MHSPSTAGRRRIVAALGALALGLGAALVAPAASAAPGDVASGTLSWGFKQSFRNYVGSQTAALPPIGALPMGERITLRAPAQFDLDGTPATPSNTSTPNETLPYLLPAAGGTVTDAANLRIETAGGVDYHFPSHFFEIGISNVAVVVAGGQVTLEADIDSVVTGSFGDFEEGEFHETGVTVGTVANPVVTLGSDTVTVSGTGVTLTAEGAQFLPYSVGDPLDDFTVTATVAAEAPTWNPQIVLSKSHGFNPDGSETVTVSGTGFDPLANLSTRVPVTPGQPSGVYVVFGKFADTWQPSAGAPGSARKVIEQRWAIPEPSLTQVATDYPSQAAALVPLNPDGTFTVTLTVRPDDTVEGNYGVYTYAGGGATANPAQELFAPVRFTADDALDIDVTVPEYEEPGGPGEPGEFVWRIDGGVSGVSLGTAEVSGDAFVASGALAPIVVTDTREGAPAWSISGQVSDFSAGAQSFDGKYLGWTPAVLAEGAGAAPGAAVAPGFTDGQGLKESRTLGFAAAGHPLGSATLGGQLLLRLPLTTEQGAYSGVLTITAVG